MFLTPWVLCWVDSCLLVCESDMMTGQVFPIALMRVYFLTQNTLHPRVQFLFLKVCDCECNELQ